MVMVHHMHRVRGVLFGGVIFSALLIFTGVSPYLRLVMESPLYFGRIFGQMVQRYAISFRGFSRLLDLKTLLLLSLL
jgi:hypothetical protein